MHFIRREKLHLVSEWFEVSIVVNPTMESVSDK